jgi:hypothetical protein
MASWQGWILMQTIPVDFTSAVVQFVDAVMWEHDELDIARKQGMDAVQRVIEAAPANAYDWAIDELRTDRFGREAFPAIKALLVARDRYRNVIVRLTDDDIRGNTHPDWIATEAAWVEALIEARRFCRLRTERTPDGKTTDQTTHSGRPPEKSGKIAGLSNETEKHEVITPKAIVKTYRPAEIYKALECSDRQLRILAEGAGIKKLPTKKGDTYTHADYILILEYVVNGGSADDTHIDNAKRLLTEAKA